MKKPFALACFAAGLLALSACGDRVPEEGAAAGGKASSEETTAGQPKAVAVEPDFDFGEVEEGVNVEHVFKLRNEGNAELAILSAKGS